MLIYKISDIIIVSKNIISQSKNALANCGAFLRSSFVPRGTILFIRPNTERILRFAV